MPDTDEQVTQPSPHFPRETLEYLASLEARHPEGIPPGLFLG